MEKRIADWGEHMLSRQETRKGTSPGMTTKQKLSFMLLKGGEYVQLKSFVINVPPGTAGTEAVDVTFSVNADWVFEVMARSVSTGRGSGILIQRSCKQFADVEIKQYREIYGQIEGHKRKHTETDKARNA